MTRLTAQRHMISYIVHTADKPSIICLCSVFQSLPTGNWTQLPRRARSMWFSRSAVQGHKCAERCCRAGVMRHYKLAAVEQRRRHLVSCRFTIYWLRPNNDKDHKNQLRHVCPSTLTRPQRPDPRFCRAVTVWRLCVRADTDDFMTTHHSVTRSKRCGIKSLRL